MHGFQKMETSRVNNFKHMVLWLFFLGTILGVIYLCTEAIVVRKFILSLILPVGFCWLGLLALTYFLFVNNRKWLGLLAMLLTLIYSLCGNEFVATILAKSLEQPFLEFRIEDAQPMDVLVLLGGGTRFGPQRQSQLGSGGDRVMVALRMYQAGKARKILCTGSAIESLADPDEPNSGEQSYEILIAAGVSRDALDLVDGRNTMEEIINIKKKLGEGSVSQSIGLVSSAWHLPRVMRLAKKHGLQAEPIPADFLFARPRFNILTIVPSASSMSANGKLLKELIAKAYGE